MGKSITALLADSPDDDNSGQIASQGFSYQEWYAVLLVTELLEKPDDFAVGMEVKEDIVVLNSATTPTAVEFCQVKSNEQAVAWTFEELHKKGRILKDGTHPPSILGKLYKRRHQFDGHPSKLSFVSNTAFKIKDNGVSLNSHDYFIKNLSEKSKTLVARAIAEQLSLSENDIELNEIRLHRSNLPLGEQHIFISGKLSELARKQLLDFKVPQPIVAATMLASEMRKKASNTSFAASFEELKVKRLMSRREALETLIHLSAPPKSAADKFDEGLARLDQEEYDYEMVEDMKSQKVNLLLAISNRTNLLFKRQATTLLECYHELKAAEIPEKKKLGSFIERLASEAWKKNRNDFITMEKPLLYALSLMVIRHGIDINVFTIAAGAQSKGQE